MPAFSNISGSQISLLATAVALLLAIGKEPNDISRLGNFLIAVGSIMVIFAGQEETNQAEKPASPGDEEIEPRLHKLEEQLAQLCKEKGCG